MWKYCKKSIKKEEKMWPKEIPQRIQASGSKSLSEEMELAPPPRSEAGGDGAKLRKEKKKSSQDAN